MESSPKAAHPLGSLEEKVMNALWASGPLPVREVSKRLGNKSKLAYTTVMTTLDRLYKKGLLSRTKDGLAYVYEPALSRDEHQQQMVEGIVSGLMSKSADAAPVLAAFVDAAAGLDEDNLQKLETLIANRRKTGS